MPPCRLARGVQVVTIEIRFITREQANAVVSQWHSHHKPIKIDILRCGAFIDGEIVGVAIGALLVAPALARGLTTIEVVRVACRGGDKNVASRLIASVWNSAKALGFTRGISYTRADELGTSYKAAGWVATARVKAKAWTTGNHNVWLPGLHKPATEVVDRIRWEVGPQASTTRVAWKQSANRETVPPQEAAR